MRQIAERAEVSIGTVSHVINGTAKVRRNCAFEWWKRFEAWVINPASWRAVFGEIKPAWWE